MILVAATACGIAWAQSVEPIDRESQIAFHVLWASPIVACWTAAVVVIRLRSPRPPLRRLLRQPGAACGVSALLIIAIWSLILSVKAAHVGLYSYWDIYFGSIPIGAAVLVSWLIPWLTRTARPEASGIDRLGRFLAVCWVGEMILMMVDLFSH